MATFDEKTKSDGLREKLVSVRRTSKVVTGGRIFGFSAVTVVGNGKGKVGVGHGKAKEVPVAIQKSLENARKNMVQVLLKKNTIFHDIIVSYGASTVIMKPAQKGTGIIAGGAMRAVLEVLGIENILTKCIGSTSPINVVRATLKALGAISSPDYIAKKRGKSVSEIIGYNYVQKP